MSPSGLVITRFVQPVPGPVVQVATVLAAKSRSDALLVTTAGVLLVAVLPVAEAVTSTGLTESIPAYSRMRMSGKVAATVKVTLTVFAGGCRGDVPRVVDGLRERAGGQGGAHRQLIRVRLGIGHRDDLRRGVVPADDHHAEVPGRLRSAEGHAHGAHRRLRSREVPLNETDGGRRLRLRQRRGAG